MSGTENRKICHVLHGVVGGGSEQVVLNYCSRMPNIHFDLFYQYEPNPQILERFVEAGFNCVQIPDKVHHPIRHVCTMFRLFRKNRYDVVHSHLDWFLNAYVMFLAWLAKIPKRIAHHHQAYQSKKRYLRFFCTLLRFPNKIFATHWLACGSLAAVDGWGKNAVANGRVLVLPNAIDPDRFKFAEVARKSIRSRYEIAEDDFVIGHVGRFFPQKNHTFLIDVFAEQCRVRPQSKLLLLGDGPLQNEILQKTESLGLSDKVIFAGLQKDPAPFYSAMDVFCFPSLWEGLGIVLLEAQCNGLPCVVSEMVPAEVQVMDSFFKLSLDISPKTWAMNMDSVSRSNVASEKMRMFDIKKNFRILEDLYTGRK